MGMRCWSDDALRGENTTSLPLSGGSVESIDSEASLFVGGNTRRMDSFVAGAGPAAGATDSCCTSLDISREDCCCCWLLDGLCGHCDLGDRDCCGDRGSIEFSGDNGALSGSSTSSSAALFFLSFLLNRPLSIPGFLSLRFLSSLPFSFETAGLSLDSGLPRPSN